MGAVDEKIKKNLIEKNFIKTSIGFFSVTSLKNALAIKLGNATKLF